MVRARCARAAPPRAYYSVGAGSVGLLAGAQSKAMYLLFMTQDALKKFEDSKRAGPPASMHRW